ncbi:hypothetical protein ACFCWD_05145 [Streptomyces sp. NPDC056374]|uniref:Mu transposase C-terminal domain-containing protein n=1 Tax=unclassified Streptomyces TaxID=2593676 RepID=UPI001E539231|nr:Mu transposase C-terminal domain-containing protein [Streptomyces sp. MBT42]MCD2466961.1 Mu transposase C-terminal domain-containing protein [Streptomyces sp. MBT42]
MSITSPIPALRGPDGTGLRAEGQALLLRRAREELHIPLKAVARVRVEGRTVAVELTAPAGATPHVQRFADVDEAAATAFADGVNAALPEQPETVDGAGYISSTRLGDPSVGRVFRVIKRGALHGTLAIVALCVLVIATGHAAGIVIIIPSGFLGLFFLVLGWATSYPSREERHLRKHGVTVAAERAPGEQSVYLYKDPEGLSRAVGKFADTWTIDVAYDPQDPGHVVVLRSRGVRALDLALTGSGLLIGLVGAAGAVTGAVLALLGVGGL